METEDSVIRHLSVKDVMEGSVRWAAVIHT